MKDEAKKGSVEPSLVALLQDRINVFEGRLQIYGTQFDWDASGKLCPKPIQDPVNVDTLRQFVGLPPMKEAIDHIRLRAEQEGEQAPNDMQEREAKFFVWAQRVGWRK